MKLRPEFITQDLDGMQYLVAVGGEQFNGIVRSNDTAAFIVNCLKEETTENAIVDKMSTKYDATRDEIAKDVSEIIKKLKSINALQAR